MPGNLDEIILADADFVFRSVFDQCALRTEIRRILIYVLAISSSVPLSAFLFLLLFRNQRRIPARARDTHRRWVANLDTVGTVAACQQMWPR